MLFLAEAERMLADDRVVDPTSYFFAYMGAASALIFASNN